MRQQLTVACPRCNQPIDVLYSYDPGTREIPPTEDADFSHKCDGADETEFTDPEQQTFDVRVLEALVAKADADADALDATHDTPADHEDNRNQYPFAGDVL